MRWFVEVSSIGDGSASEKLCIEAKQWLTALEEARRLRGEPDALSKFSIEVLDEGYRAVNAALNTRYLVRPAPSDAPLTEGVGERSTFRALGSGSSSQRAPTPSRVPAATGATSERPHPTSNPPSTLPASELIRKITEGPTAESPILYYEAAYAVEPGLSRPQIERVLLKHFQKVCAEIARGSSKKYVQLAIFDHHYEKYPVRPPLATLTWKDWRGAPVLGFPAFGEKPATGSMAPPPKWDNHSSYAVSMPVTAPENSAPRADNPASVSPSTTPSSILPSTSAVQVIRSIPVGEAVSTEILSIPKAAPVPNIESPSPESAVPQHSEVRPTGVAEGAPASLVAPSEPKTVSEPVSEPEALSTAPVTQAPVTQVSASIAPAGAPEAKESPEAKVETAEAKASPESEATAAEATADQVTAESKVDAPLAEAPLSEGSAPAASGPTKKKGKKSKAKSASGKSRPSRSKPGERRGADEDLISELFERMHELYFASDVAEGAEFVCMVLREVLPSEAIVVSVFDLSAREFVVVRTFPEVRDALLLRSADTQPLVREAMRRPTSLRVTDAAKDGRFTGEVWDVLRVTPRVAMCGAVRRGGRDLGLIQLANPLGAEPFSEAEANALDYVCQCFAEFLENRPIVLEADTIFPPE